MPRRRRESSCSESRRRNVVNELNALVAFGGLELDAAHTELAVPAGLFLVLAFGVCLAADGFTIGTFGGLSVR